MITKESQGMEYYTRGVKRVIPSSEPSRSLRTSGCCAGGGGGAGAAAGCTNAANGLASEMAYTAALDAAGAAAGDAPEPDGLRRSELSCSEAHTSNASLNTSRSTSLARTGDIRRRVCYSICMYMYGV